MVVCLSVKTGSSETVFQYLGSDTELWARAVKRVLTDPNNKAEHLIAEVELQNENFMVGRSELRRLRYPIAYPEDYILIEKIVQQVSCGQWNDLDLHFATGFKTAIRYVWNAVKDKLALECSILDALYSEGNGGLKVESILSRLLAAGVVARFGAVRDALGHLCKLCLVERAYGQFSIREGMLNR